MIKLQEKETAQETFDFVVGKLREQGVPSAEITMAGGVFCNYGQPGGLRCAVGHLMGDQTCDGGTLMGCVENELSVARPRDYMMLRSMQGAHDSAALGAKIEGSKEPALDNNVWCRVCATKMAEIANSFNLDPSSAQAWLESLQ